MLVAVVGYSVNERWRRFKRQQEERREGIKPVYVTSARQDRSSSGGGLSHKLRSLRSLRALGLAAAWTQSDRGGASRPRELRKAQTMAGGRSSAFERFGVESSASVSGAASASARVGERTPGRGERTPCGHASLKEQARSVRSMRGSVTTPGRGMALKGVTDHETITLASTNV